jgi:hypothetical protein
MLPHARITLESSSSHELDLALWREATLAHANFLDTRIHAPKLDSLTIRQGVHGRFANVEASVRVIDAQDEDTLALVGDLVACPTLCRVPASNVDTSSNVRKVGNLTLRRPAIAWNALAQAVSLIVQRSKHTRLETIDTV